MEETPETPGGPLDLDDPLEQEMATHSSILVWKILWTEELGGLPFIHGKESEATEHAYPHTPLLQNFLHTCPGKYLQIQEYSRQHFIVLKNCKLNCH